MRKTFILISVQHGLVIHSAIEFSIRDTYSWQAANICYKNGHHITGILANNRRNLSYEVLYMLLF